MTALEINVHSFTCALSENNGSVYIIKIISKAVSVQKDDLIDFILLTGSFNYLK